MINRPQFRNDDPLYSLLRDGDIDGFNAKKKTVEGTIDLSLCDFRSLDLKGLDASNIDFRNSYFRQADLRGIDFSQSNLEGASINGSKISGAYFPKELTANEVELSLIHGTRMRYSMGDH
ncbi:pentapeptide repeat-containing protein [Pseudomonadota bacterium]